MLERIFVRAVDTDSSVIGFEICEQKSVEDSFDTAKSRLSTRDLWGDTLCLILKTAFGSLGIEHLVSNGLRPF